MLQIFRKIIFRQSEDHQQDPFLHVTHADIDKAYTKVKQEVESLAQYDRGQKEINAPDLKKLRHNI